MGDARERERRLRELRLERRQVQEELEAAVVEAAAASTTLVDALWDVGERAQRCTVEVGPHRLSGVVAHVGDDVVRLVTESGGSWDVAVERLGAVWVEGGSTGVRRLRPGHPRTLLARARELVVGEAPVEVGRVDRADAVRGRLEAVSSTHLLVRRPDGGAVLVVWPVVAWLAEGSS